METTINPVDRQLTAHGKLPWIHRLKEKWGIHHTWQVVCILLVFSLAGSTAVTLKPVYFGVLGIDSATPLWIKISAYLLFLFPTYQTLLLAYGALLGQFGFFWKKEKQLVLQTWSFLQKTAFRI